MLTAIFFFWKWGKRETGLANNWQFNPAVTGLRLCSRGSGTKPFFNVVFDNLVKFIGNVVTT